MLGVTRTLWPFLAILLILSTITFASAIPRTRKMKYALMDESKLLTNSARFQAGLGPLRPRSMNSPTRVQGVHSARPSPSPQPATRTIEVRSMDNNMSIGFVSNKMGRKGSFGLTKNDREKLVVTYVPSSTAPFSLAIKGTKQPFLGFSGENLSSPDTPNRNSLVETEKTPPISAPRVVGSSSYDKSESSIWSYDKQTHQLTAQWINMDGESPPTLFWYYTKDLALGLVNCTSSNSSLGQEVQLYLV